MGAKSPIQPVGPESWRNIPSEPFIGIPRSVKLCTEEKWARICGLHKNVRKVREKHLGLYCTIRNSEGNLRPLAATLEWQRD